jgi:hypothetical protein
MFKFYIIYIKQGILKILCKNNLFLFALLLLYGHI